MTGRFVIKVLQLRPDYRTLCRARARVTRIIFGINYSLSDDGGCRSFRSPLSITCQLEGHHRRRNNATRQPQIFALSARSYPPVPRRYILLFADTYRSTRTVFSWSTLKGGC